MKRIILIAGLSAASLALAACNKTATEEENAADTQSVSEEAVAEEPIADDAATGEEAAADAESLDDGDRGNDGGRQTGS
jgi:hypothetical protein